MSAAGVPELDRIDLLAAHLSDVRAYLLAHPAPWPELDELISHAAAAPLQPYVLLPLAAAAGAGGDPRDAVPVAAAWALLSEAMRILDDLQDRDRPGALYERVGAARAFNFAAALYGHAHGLLAAAAWNDELHRRVSRLFASESVAVAAGQDLDLRGDTPSLARHWSTIAGKNGRAYALACGAGATAAAAPPEVVAACAEFGQHLGVILQVFDDIEGVWGHDGADLERGRPGLPLAFALEADHPDAAELRELVRGGMLAPRAARVRELLDAIDTRSALLCAALDERTAALAALSRCPDRDGALVLAAFVTAVFTDVLEIAGELPG